LATVPWAALIVVALLVIAFLSAALLLAGCTVGPDYRRPAVAVPPDFRGGPPGTAESLGDVAWWKIFQDETLQSLIRTALAENYDLAYRGRSHPRGSRPGHHRAIGPVS